MNLTIGAIRVSTDIQADRYGPDRQRDDITREERWEEFKRCTP
ncbi:hypothetical protein [Deinococcus sp. NW-56]|nr:hypothetical protein [Deinococcus sp. NW-56]